MDTNKLLSMISQYGKNKDGSFTRLGFSKEYFSAVDYLEKLLKDLGLKTWIDPVGNLHGLLQVNPEYKTILMGSHLDTVPQGGLYDGALGIALAISTIFFIKKENIKLNYNIEVIAFNAEEGGAMGGTFGSRAMMGLIAEEDLLENDLAEYNLTKEDIEKSKVSTEKYLCFLEPHVEQGGVLEAENTKIGIVSGIVGISRYDIISSGKSNHSGTTPMKVREDALYILSLFIKYAYESALSLNNNLVSTIGELEISPGAVNVIPGMCRAKLEVRHIDQEAIDSYISSLDAYSDFFLDAKVEIVNYIKKASVRSDEKLVKLMENVCKKENISHIIMPSGAGHDASSIASKVPTVMFFVPSKDGISHSRDEFTSSEDIEIGEKLLRKTVLKINDTY